MIKIAIAKGRIEKETLKILEKLGIDMTEMLSCRRKLKIQLTENLEILLPKSTDVLKYLDKDLCDVAFLGRDTLLEAESSRNEYIEVPLDCGYCKICLCRAKNKKSKSDKIRIATKYPSIANRYFCDIRGLKKDEFSIVKLNGSVELGAISGMADAIVDIVDTGETIKDNGLYIEDIIAEVETVAVAKRKRCENDSEIGNFMAKLANSNVKRGTRSFSLGNKKVEFEIYNPGGNITALVDGLNYDSMERRKINDYILQKFSQCEQVGFFDRTLRRLEMAGGELCINATRCAFWSYLRGKYGTCELTVVGPKTFKGGIDFGGEVYVEVSFDRKMCDLVFKKNDMEFVDLGEIVLAVIDESKSRRYMDMLESNAKDTLDKIKKVLMETDINSPAIGMIFMEKSKEQLKIVPVIWVKKVDTLYLETACGSGSIASSIIENLKSGISSFKVVQPSGSIIKTELKIEERILKTVIVKGGVTKL